MNVMASFMARKPKWIVRERAPPKADASGDKKWVETLVSPDPSQGVLVEKSEGVILKSNKKIANLNIVDSERIRVEIPGVVSSVEFLRCTDVTIVCSNFGTTFSVEKCEKVLLKFPSDSKDVKIVTLQSLGVKVAVFEKQVGSFDEEKDWPMTEVAVLDIDQRIVELGLKGEEGSPAVEILSKWDNDAFETHVLQREQTSKMPVL